MQQRVETAHTAEVAPKDDSDAPYQKSAREQELDRSNRIWGRILLALLLFFAAFKAYALLAPKYLN
ncbi:MAG: hypothetical protein AAFR70_06105 [Pseudomonadota bacterium]